ncbi:MAG: FAD-dependent oxidoreductase, partial [Armatimonadota bacterium]
FDCNPRVPVYTIPFRCLYSRNIENLLFAGRDISVTHIALGSVRVQGTLASLGQAAGTAAAMCVRYAVTPRGIYEERIQELQQTLLKHDQYIPGVANQSPGDLARRATVVASSTAEFDEFTRDDVRKGQEHPLNMPRAMMFPWASDEALQTVHVLLVSEQDDATEVRVHLRESAEPGDFSSARDLKTATVIVPPHQESWVPVEVNADVGARYAWVWLEAADGVSWRLMRSAPRGSCRAYAGANTGEWTVVKGQYYAIFTDPPIATETDYRPENVINGVARVVDEHSNMWASDPSQPMPQWIELRFERPVEVNTIYLTFDTDMNARYHDVPLVPECVRDYELAYHDGRKWSSLAKVRGNFQRRRVHRFETVRASRLRLTVHATNGDKSVRVFEIRAYEE